MDRITPKILLASTVISLFRHVSFAADDPSVPVASCLNTPANQKIVGARAYAILHAHNITAFGVGSRGVTINVPASRAEEALRLLAKAIKAERLDLTLCVRKAGGYETVTPDSILAPKKNQ